jgi:hypothetical protein
MCPERAPAGFEAVRERLLAAVPARSMAKWR